MGLVHGVNTRPLVCWVSSARSADAREARFLVEFSLKICQQLLLPIVFTAKRNRTGARIRYNPIYNLGPIRETHEPTLSHHVDLEPTGKCCTGQSTFSLLCLVIIILVTSFSISFGVLSLQSVQLFQPNAKTIQRTPPTKGIALHLTLSERQTSNGLLMYPFF